MLDPAELVSAARALASSRDGVDPSEAQFRRAVSTAYYAVFHSVLRAASQRFMGAGHETTAGYAVLYRGFDQRMKMVCEALRVAQLKGKYRRYLRRNAVSQDMQDFAGAFPGLQEARHRADYDPAAEFGASDVAALIDAAELAMNAFRRADAEEQADVLALLLVGARN